MTPIFNKVLGIPGAFTPYRLEVDDGQLMLAGQNGLVLLRDLAANEETLLDFGVQIPEIAQVFVRL